MSEKVLFVDDEANILQAYSRTLRKQFDIQTALGGAEGLSAADNDGPFAVVVSDMRMPEMDGIEYLSRMKAAHPDTVRVMLTGNADQQTAIAAVNQGDVFRFLNKPCPPEKMAATLNAAIDQYRMITAEKDLLENTLKGSIEALAEVLALTNPEVFGLATTYQQLLMGCSQEMGLAPTWQLETMPMLSMVGTVPLPQDLVKKALSGDGLSDEETGKFDRHAELGSSLIAKIPRMEELATCIRYQRKNFDGSGTPQDDVAGADIPVGARLLKVVVDYSHLVRGGRASDVAIEHMALDKKRYDPQVVAALQKFVSADGESEGQTMAVGVTQLKDNMVIAEDVTTAEGTLLVCKGQKLSSSVSERLINFWHNGAIGEQVLVTLLADENDEAADEAAAG